MMTWQKIKCFFGCHTLIPYKNGEGSWLFPEHFGHRCKHCSYDYSGYGDGGFDGTDGY